MAIKMTFEAFSDKYLDCLLVPSGLLVLIIYQAWLYYNIRCHPSRTVIGRNTLCRSQWVYHIMSDQARNGTLAVQTLRIHLMASAVLATISITLSSLIGAVISSLNQPTPVTYTIHHLKYFSLLVCFLVAFFCNMQCVRYYSHSSFLLNVPIPDQGSSDDFVEYITETLNAGSQFWSLGLRAFYFSFPLLLWIFGPVPMFGCSCLISYLLYYLDMDSGRSASLWYLRKCQRDDDMETHSLYFGSVADSIETVHSVEDNIYHSLAGNSRPGSTTNGSVSSEEPPTFGSETLNNP